MVRTERTRVPAAHAVLAVLRGWGVRVLFGLPGSTEAALLEALRQARDLRYVLTLQEGVAVAMADGFARATGAPGVVNLHTSVGTLAGLSQLYNAWRDRVPVVVVASHKDTRLLGRGGFTSLPDTTALVRPLCKWAHQTLRAEQVAEDVGRAFQQATSSPPGPAYVLVPEDLLAEPCPEPEEVATPRALPPRAHPDAVHELVARLLASRRPVAVAGSQLAGEGARLLADLARRLAIPVLWEPRRSLLQVPYPADDPHFVGIYDPDHPAVVGADLLVVLGAVLFVEFSPPAAPEIPPHVPLVHVHLDAGELGRLYPPALSVHGHPALVVRDVLDALAERQDELDRACSERRPWVAALRTRWEARRTAPAAQDRAGEELSARQVGAALGRVTPADTLVVEEAVRSSVAFLEGYPVQPGGLLRTSGGSLGWGVPAAMGAQVALPNRPVVAVVGDGCLHFTPQALWTGVRQHLPVLVVVLNNRKYLAVEAGVRRLLGGRVEEGTPGIQLPGIDHVQVAQGYGAWAVRVESADQLEDALREGFLRARQEGRPCLVDVPVRDEPGA